MLKIVLKVALIMLLYFTVSLFIPIKYSVMNWLFSYLSYSSSMCILGNKEARKEIFFYFSIIFLLIASISYYINKFTLLSGIFLLAIAYSTSYIRATNPKFKLFSIYTIIVCAISTLNNPIPPSALFEFILSILIIGSCFFITVINYAYNVDSLLRGLVKLTQLNLANNFKQIMNNISSGEDLREHILFTKVNIKKECEIMSNKGYTLINNKNLSNLWSTIWRTILRLNNLSFQVLFYYQSLKLERNRSSAQFVKNSVMFDLLNKMSTILSGVFRLNIESFNELIKELSNEASLLEKEIVMNTVQLKNNISMAYEILISIGAFLNILRDLRTLVDDLP